MEYICSICSKQYDSPKKLGGHKTVHTRPYPEEKDCAYCQTKTLNKKFCSLRCKTDYWSADAVAKKSSKFALVHKTKGQSSVRIELDITNKELEEYRKLHQKCEICGKKCSLNRKLAVDHDHNSNRFRGLLCFKCNIALGHLENHLVEVGKYLNKL